MESLATPEVQSPRAFLRAREWLEERDYRPLWHLLAVVSIVAAACFLFYRHFSTPGVLMHSDMTWPDTLSRLNSAFLHTWMQYSSKSNIPNMQRLFWTYPFLIPARLLNLSMERFLLIMYIFTFSLAGVSMYALCYDVIGSLKLKSRNLYAPFLGAIFAALVYMYNPWSIGHFWSYYMFPTYALIPLVFLCCKWTLAAPNVKRAILLSLLLATASTGPLGVVWLWVLVVSYVVFYVAINRFKREIMMATMKVLLQTVIFYALLCAMWMLPYVGAVLSHKTMIPHYSSPVSSSMITATSANNSVANNLQLVSGWGFPIKLNPTNTLLVVLSFAAPILALITLLVMKEKFRKSASVNYWMAVFIFSIVFATGSSFILKKPYLYMAVNSPASGPLGWLFRAPDRWLALVPTFYALMLGILLAYLLSRVAKKEAWLRKYTKVEIPGAGTSSSQATLVDPEREQNWKDAADQMSRLEAKLDRLELIAQKLRHYGMLILAALMVAVVLLSYYPVTLLYAQRVMNPTSVPAKYENVNRWLAKKAPEAQVLWLPFWGANRYAWAGGKRLGPFEIFSSNPSIFPFLITSGTFAYWLQNEVYQLGGGFEEIQLLNREKVLGLAASLLAPYGAIFVVVDTSIPGTEFATSFKSDKGLKQVYSSESLVVYQIPHSPGALRAAAKTVVAQSFFDYLSILQKVSGDIVSKTAFVDQTSGIPKTMALYDIKKYETPVVQNGDFEFPVQGKVVPNWRLENNQENTAITLDKEKPSWSKGKQSLRVVNKRTSTWGLSWITGSEIPVIPSQMYTVETSLKYQNVTWTSIVIDGYNESKKEWQTLMRCPNIVAKDSDWRRCNASFVVPEGYSMIRPRLVAGWVYNKARGPAVSWFDDINISRVENSLFTDLSQPMPSPSIKYIKRSPEKYEVEVTNAVAPFMLVFSQAYDPLWVARTDEGKTIQSVSCYGTINGFPIDFQKKRDFTITIEYLPQRWFMLGLFLSVAVLLLLMLYLLYDWRYGERLPVKRIPAAVARSVLPTQQEVGRLAEPEERRNVRLERKAIRPQRKRKVPLRRVPAAEARRIPHALQAVMRFAEPEERRNKRLERKAIRPQRKRRAPTAENQTPAFTMGVTPLSSPGDGRRPLSTVSRLRSLIGRPRKRRKH